MTWGPLAGRAGGGAVTGVVGQALSLTGGAEVMVSPPEHAASTDTMISGRKIAKIGRKFMFKGR